MGLTDEATHELSHSHAPLVNLKLDGDELISDIGVN